MTEHGCTGFVHTALLCNFCLTSRIDLIWINKTLAIHGNKQNIRHWILKEIQYPSTQLSHTMTVLVEWIDSQTERPIGRRKDRPTVVILHLLWVSVWKIKLISSLISISALLTDSLYKCHVCIGKCQKNRPHIKHLIDYIDKLWV